MINIEEDEVTCNSYVVFSQVKKDLHNFIYVDRHGNWVVGKLKQLLFQMADRCIGYIF